MFGKNTKWKGGNVFQAVKQASNNIVKDEMVNVLYSTTNKPIFEPKEGTLPPTLVTKVILFLKVTHKIKYIAVKCITRLIIGPSKGVPISKHSSETTLLFLR